MKYEMTSRDRMLAAIRRQPVDHIPLGQLFHSTVLNTPADKQWTDQFERARVMKELGIDPTIDIWMPAPEAPPEIPVRKWHGDGRRRDEAALRGLRDAGRNPDREGPAHGWRLVRCDSLPASCRAGMARRIATPTNTTASR